MLHHYNYPTSLSHFLSFNHPFDETGSQATTDGEQTAAGLCGGEDERCKSATPSNKSFTIAAILGLKGGGDPADGDASVNVNGSVVNLSVHGGGGGGVGERRMQMPVVRGHHFVGTTSRHAAVRGLKHLQAMTAAGKAKACKSKRVRTIFTPEQLERLEAEFERQQYMVGPERLYLAHTLQLTEAQVKVWFQNRRIKWRKHHLELTHQRLAVLKQQQILLDDHHPDIQDTNSSSTDT